MCTKNRRYCTMHKKVLYDIKKIKKMWGGGAIFEPKTLYVFKKEKEKKHKKTDRAGIRTHDLRVRKTCSLIHLAKHYYSNYKI